MTLHNIFAYFKFVGMQHGYDIDNVLLVNILVFVLIAKKRTPHKRNETSKPFQYHLDFIQVRGLYGST
jgi:hypothetical protein